MKRIGDKPKTAQAEVANEFLAIYRVFRDAAGEVNASNIFIAKRSVAEPIMNIPAAERGGSWKFATRYASRTEVAEFFTEQPHLKKMYEKAKILAAEDLVKK